ncbi:MAG: holo-ACP synthase [Lachnospiraceae bacterium]
MIVGTGVDIVETARVEKACAKQHFLLRCFTAWEIEQAKGRAESLAGYFAAKEAVAKALGTGVRGFGLLDIEVRKNELGKPEVQLYGKAKLLAESLEINQIHLSISHEKTMAIAFVVAERK